MSLQHFEEQIKEVKGTKGKMSEAIYFVLFMPYYRAIALAS